MKKILRQVITSKTKILIPLLLLSLILVFTFCVSDVSAAQVGSDNARVTSDNLTVSGVQTTSNSSNSTADNLSNSSDSNNQTLPDPQVWRDGQQVGPNYNTIQEAIDAAQSGDTIMLENGATFYEHDLVISKNLTFNVLGGGHATIDAQGQGRIFYINSGVTVNIYNLTLQNGVLYYYYASDLNGGAIYNEGTLNLINCAFTANRAGVGFGGIGDITGDGGAIDNLGILTITNSTFTGNSAGREDLYEGMDLISHGSGGAIKNSGTLTITNSTFTGNNAYYGYGGAILNLGGTLTITNSTFNRNSAKGGSAGAIYNYLGTLTITNCTLTDNSATIVIGSHSGYTSVIYGQADAGAILNYQGTLTITNSTFTGNNGNPGNGGAIFNYANDGYALAFITNSTFTGNYGYNGGLITGRGGDGGTICNYANNGTAFVSITNSTFTGNSANWGGAVFTGVNNGTAFAYIKDSVFTGNEASHGGAIYNIIQGTGSSTVDVNFNRIVGNIADSSNSGGICNINGMVDADNNWWGNNTPDFSKLLYGMPDPDSWLVMSATANPTSIRVGDSSTITVTISSYNKTTNTYSPVTHCAPIPAIFTATLGDMNPESTFIIPNLGIDQVTSIFTSTNAGTATINATVDNETIIFTIQANITPTIITVPNVTGYYGDNATITAILKDDLGRPVAGETVHFYVDLIYIGSATTDSTGTATLNYPLNFSVGSHTIQAVFHDDPYKYTPSGGTGTLTVNINPTTILVTSVHNFAGQNVTLTANVTDFYGHPVNEGSVRFTVNGNYVNTVSVNNGEAILNWTIPLNWSTGTYPNVIFAEYLGTTNYTTSNIYGNLTVDKTPTTVNVENSTNFAGQTVDLVAHVTDYYTQPVNEGQIRFTVNGVIAGAANVINGRATLNWLIPSDWNVGTYDIVAVFNGTGTNYANSTDNGTLTVNTQSALNVVKESLVSQIIAGVTYTDPIYRITVTNNGPSDARNVQVQDTIPSQIVDREYRINNGDWTSFTGDLNQLILYIANGTSGAIEIRGKILSSTPAGSITNVASASAYGTSFNSNTVNTDIVNQAALNVVKTGLPEVTAGETYTGLYTITVTNNGPSDARNVQVQDNIPGQIVDREYRINGGAWISFSGALDQIISYLESGASSVIEVRGRIPSSTPAGSMTNIVSASVYGTSFNSNTVNTAIIKSTDVDLTKTVDKARPNVGDTVTFTVTVRNNGPSDATNIGIGDLMPSDFADVMVTPSRGTYVGGVWTLDLASGDEATLTITGKVTSQMAGKNTTNTALLQGSTVSANATIYVPKSDLYIKITANKNNPKVGETFILTYKLGNNGPDSAENVTITIPLPEGFEISNINGDGIWTYDANTRTITWALVNVEVGDPYLYISGRITRLGNYVFSSSISSETYNINSEGVTPITISAIQQVKAVSKTIPLQHTGLPLAGLILAVLAVFSGLVAPRRKS